MVAFAERQIIIMEKLTEYLDTISFENTDFDSFCEWRYREDTEEKIDEIANKVDNIKTKYKSAEEEGEDFRLDVLYQIYEEADNGELSEIVADDFKLFYILFYCDENMKEFNEIMKWYCENL